MQIRGSKRPRRMGGAVDYDGGVMRNKDWLVDGSARAKATVVLAHGAGAAMDSPFMEAIADGLVARGLRVVRFEFPYMRHRRAEGGRRPPDSFAWGIRSTLRDGPTGCAVAADRGGAVAPPC